MGAPQLSLHFIGSSPSNLVHSIRKDIISLRQLMPNNVIPENIQTPPTDGQWRFLGGEGAKGYKFPRGTGGAHGNNFPQGCKRRDRSYEKYLSICGLF